MDHHLAPNITSELGVTGHHLAPNIITSELGVCEFVVSCNGNMIYGCMDKYLCRR